MFADALSLSVAWFCSALIGGLLTEIPLDEHYLTSRGGFLLVYLCLNCFARLYHGNPLYPGIPLAPVEEFRRLTITTIGVGILFFAYLSFYGKTSPIPWWVVFVTVVLNILLAQPFRTGMRILLKHLGLAQIPVVIVGPPEETKALVKRFRTSSHIGLEVRGVFTQTEQTLDFAHEYNIKHCISCQSLRVFRMSIYRLLSWFSVLVCIPESKVFPIALTNPTELWYGGGYGGLEMANQLRQKGVRWAKHALESVITLFAILICLLPGIVIILIQWVLYGRKGIFYSTMRLGKCGRPFRLWKFRTMIPDADAQLKEILEANPELKEEWRSTGKLQNDPRVTKFGAWLRKTSLDEIPQLFNVLRHEMSLIGPRPIVTREVPFYGESYSVVSGVRPGITGLWQVSGRSDVGYESRVTLDLYYAQNWNLWLDLWIFLRTFSVVLFQRGAC